MRLRRAGLPSLLLGSALLAQASLAPPFAGPAAAGPPEIVAALKQAPASLFDLSMARLEALVQADGIQGAYHGWVYLQDEEIVIATWSLSAPPTEEACRDIIDRLKRLAAVDPATGFPDDPASRFASLFRYPSLNSAEIDSTYEETVDGMFHLKAVIGIAGDGQALICQGPLLSGEVRFSRE